MHAQFCYLITLVTLITLCHQLVHMVKFLDTLIKFLLIIIPLFILISVSITRLTLRTRYTCMSFGCHFPPLRRVKFLFTN